MRDGRPALLRILRLLGALLGSVALLAIAALGYRAWKQHQHGAAIRIDTRRGIDWEGPVDIRGTPQWLQIRGHDSSRPLLLNLHGGPGAAIRALAYAIQPAWEKNFVVVNWDQPCGGNTYRLNATTGCGTLSIDRIAADTIAVTDHLRARFGRDKIFLLGHSWGSLLGLIVAKRAPERYHAYIGSGQMVAAERADAVAFEWTLARARAAGDQGAIAALQVDSGRRRRTYWPWLVKYGGESWRHRNSDWWTLGVAALAPKLTLAELAAWFRGNQLTNRALRAEIRAFDAYTQIGTRFNLPVVLILGKYDYNTPTPLAAEYFDAIDAPTKRLVILDESAHMPMLETPGSFATALRTELEQLTSLGRL